MSTNFGVKPFWIIGLTVVGKPTTLTIISAPSGHSKYFFNAAIITRLAELPLFTINDDSNPNRLENARSNLSTCLPAGNHLPSSRVWIAALISSPSKYGPEYRTFDAGINLLTLDRYQI